MTEGTRPMALRVGAALIVLTFLAAIGQSGSTALGSSVPGGAVDMSAEAKDGALASRLLVPGDGVTWPVLVTNRGSLELRYAVTSVVLPSPSAHLELSVWDESQEAHADGTCGTEPPTMLYGPASVGGATGNLIGDPAQGHQLGDRTLGAATQETLCFRLRIPRSADNGYQGLTTAPTFRFEAEQTENNP